MSIKCKNEWLPVDPAPCMGWQKPSSRHLSGHQTRVVDKLGIGWPSVIDVVDARQLCHLVHPQKVEVPQQAKQGDRKSASNSQREGDAWCWREAAGKSAKKANTAAASDSRLSGQQVKEFEAEHSLLRLHARTTAHHFTDKQAQSLA